MYEQMQQLNALVEVDSYLTVISGPNCFDFALTVTPVMNICIKICTFKLTTDY